MDRRFFALVVALPLLGAGCKKASKDDAIPTAAAPRAAGEVRPLPGALAPPRPAPAIDRNAQVMVLCYQRFEDKPHQGLAVSPTEFRAQMQALKDQGVAVIPMKDFLAWRRQEKAIPARSCLLTIDDGYVSAYRVAWPILKQYGYPCTLFIYTNYVNVGGKSMSWAQLAEMRDGGVDIESLTVSHHDLRRAPKGQDYLGWLHRELDASKQILEDKLAIKVSALAFPYGASNETVRKVALEAGYQALFTTEGQHLGIGAPADHLGRYAVEPNKPKSFEAALDFPGGGGAPAELRLVGTRPMNEQRIHDASPTVQATLAPVQEIDAESLEMRVSGFGLVPARYEPTDKRVSYTFTQGLLPKTYTVILSARVKGQKVEARWDFTVEGAEGPKSKSS